MTSQYGLLKVKINFILDIDPSNKGFLSYDEFTKNLSRHIKLTNPEYYIIYKISKDKERLCMKKLFKAMGGG